jgi:photosystem II stability/assembly factor-like uncharacterized protein
MMGLILSAALAHWETIPSGTDRNLYQACFLNARKGFIGAAGGLLLVTDDGGKTWASRDLGIPADVDLTDIAFASPSTAFATGLADTLLVSRDSARTWTKQSAGKFGTFSIKGYRIIPVGKGIAYLLTNYGILKSKDDCETWIPSAIQPLGEYAFTDGYFFNADTGIYVSPGLSYGGIFKTDDGLVSQRRETGSSTRYIDFLTRETGFAVNALGKCWRTDDGGDAWIQDTDFSAPGGKPLQPMDIASIGGDGVLIVGVSGFIARMDVFSPTSILPLRQDRNGLGRNSSLRKRVRINGRVDFPKHGIPFTK